jgi:hypothetical protein
METHCGHFPGRPELFQISFRLLNFYHFILDSLVFPVQSRGNTENIMNLKARHVFLNATTSMNPTIPKHNTHIL